MNYHYLVLLSFVPIIFVVYSRFISLIHQGDFTGTGLVIALLSVKWPYRIWVKSAGTKRQHNTTNKNSVHTFLAVLYVIRIPYLNYISFRVTSLALGQSYDCPSASEITLKNMGNTDQYKITPKALVWTFPIFLGVFCSSNAQLHQMNISIIQLRQMYIGILDYGRYISRFTCWETTSHRDHLS